MCILEELLKCKDDCINVRAGFYFVENKITLKNMHDKKIVFDKGAFVSGAKNIKVEWKKYNDRIMIAQLDKGLGVDGLVINKKLKIMARYPDYRDGLPLGGTVKLKGNSFKSYANPTTGYVRGLHEFAWGGNSYRIVSQKADGTLNLDWIGDNNRGSKTKEVVIENVFEELDSPEEWFYDAVTGKLYYYPAEGEENINEISILLNDELLNFENCSNIVVEGLNLCNSARCMFRHKYEPLLRGDWAIQRAGAIRISDCSDICFMNGSARYVLGNVFCIDGNNEKISICSFDMSDLGASGIVVVGKTDAVRDYSTWQKHKTKISDKTAGPRNNNYPKNILIKNNRICNIGLFEKQSAGVCISISSKVVVENNTIFKVPRACININDGTFGGHVISGNFLYDAVRETSDHGEINCWGRDRFWSYKGYNTEGKKGNKKKPFALLDAIDTTVINSNMIYSQKGFGIDLDDGASNYIIEKNICIGSGIKLREGFMRRISGNILYLSQIDLHCSYAGNGDRIFGNTFVGHKPFFTYGINKGSDTEIFDNEYVNTAPPIFDISPKIVSTDKPFDSYHLNSLLTEKKLRFDYGADFAKTPVMDFGFIKNETEMLRFKCRNIEFETMNESVKSFHGVDGGLIIKKISLFNKLRYKLRTGDVLYAINDKKVNCFEDIILQQAKTITIYRNQQCYIIQLKNRC